MNMECLPRYSHLFFSPSFLPLFSPSLFPLVSPSFLQWDDFLHECLRRAKRTEDYENGARAMLAQADRTFVDANNPNDERMHKNAPFNLLRFEGVKTTKEFARRFGVSSRGLRSGMFTYSDITLHTPLSSSSNITQGDAIVLSTLILGFTGTRQPKKGTDVETLKEELVLRGAESTDIADEIFLQIIKQLSGCPIWQIEVRGWALLHACLEAFLPSDAFKQHFEWWLRKCRGFQQQDRQLVHWKAGVPSTVGGYVFIGCL